MSGKLKPIPDFANEAEEDEFWQTHDSTDYIDWSRAERVRLPNLKPSTTTISLRMPISVLERIKIAANKRDMPYQTLIKAWLAEKVEPQPIHPVRDAKPEPRNTTRTGKTAAGGGKYRAATSKPAAMPKAAAKPSQRKG